MKALVAAALLAAVLPATAEAQHRGGGRNFGLHGQRHFSQHFSHQGRRHFGQHFSHQGQRQFGRHFSHQGQRPFGHHFDHRGFDHRGRHHFHHGHGGNRLLVVTPFVPFGSFSSSTFVYSAPPVYYAPPPVVYAPPPAVYGSTPAYAAPPAPSSAPPSNHDVEPIQREVIFPTGRYVLRGDGINTPYTWVWIPNPPTAPPGETPSSSRESERAVYSWTDANGVTSWTDRLTNVPPAYRANARREP